MKKSIGNGVVWNNAEEWEFLPSSVTMRGRRAISVTSLAAELPLGVIESGKVRVEKTFQAVPKQTGGPAIWRYSNVRHERNGLARRRKSLSRSSFSE